MIKFESNKGKVNLKVDGTIPEICTDITMGISEVYEFIFKTAGKDAADAFKFSLELAFACDIVFDEPKEESTAATTPLDPTVQSILDKINKEINNNDSNNKKI
jgi:hypothetical protein